MPCATLTSKGQITIPIQVRTALGLDAGDKIDFVEIEKGRFAIVSGAESIDDSEAWSEKFDSEAEFESVGKSHVF